MQHVKKKKNLVFHRLLSLCCILFLLSSFADKQSPLKIGIVRYIDPIWRGVADTVFRAAAARPRLGAPLSPSRPVCRGPPPPAPTPACAPGAASCASSQVQRVPPPPPSGRLGAFESGTARSPCPAGGGGAGKLRRSSERTTAQWQS